MIRWYKELYMDEEVSRHPKRCKKAVESRKLRKNNYYALMLANNPDNLFEIVQTRELFFRRYEYLDLYVFGLASEYENALALLQEVVEQIMTMESKDFKTFFEKKDFLQ